MGENLERLKDMIIEASSFDGLRELVQEERNRALTKAAEEDGRLTEIKVIAETLDPEAFKPLGETCCTAGERRAMSLRRQHALRSALDSYAESRLYG